MKARSVNSDAGSITPTTSPFFKMRHEGDSFFQPKMGGTNAFFAPSVTSNNIGQVPNLQFQLQGACAPQTQSEIGLMTQSIPFTFPTGPGSPPIVIDTFTNPTFGRYSPILFLGSTTIRNRLFHSFEVEFLKTARTSAIDIKVVGSRGTKISQVVNTNRNVIFDVRLTTGGEWALLIPQKEPRKRKGRCADHTIISEGSLT